MWWAVLAFIVAAGGALLILRKKTMGPTPHDTYVCDVCGEKDCICHKEESG